MKYRIAVRDKIFKDENGSISILVMSLFVLLLTLSISILDISDSYLAKRELTALTERAVAIAARSLDESRYYQEGLNNPGAMAPIDCQKAESVLRVEIANALLRSSQISVTKFSCSLDQVIAGTSSTISPLVSFPLLNRLVGNRLGISTEVGAGSPVQ